MPAPLVSFCMLNRDGGETIRQCLESVAHLADEFIVVDSGSSDGSPEIARSFGARVIDRPWTDDFAAARNEYVRAATGRWILSIDADEVLAGCRREDFAALLEREPNTAFRFTIRNYFLLRDFEHSLAPGDFAGRSTPGVGVTNSQTIRLFPRRRGIAYTYRVHESLAPSLRRARCRVRDLGIPIHHVGFLMGRQQVGEKFTRYLDLGRRKLREHPENPLAYLELGKLLLCSGHLEESQELFDQAAQIAPSLPNVCYYAALARFKLGRLDECRQLIDTHLRASPDDVNLRYLRGIVEQRQQRFAEAAAMFRLLAAAQPDHFPTELHLAECCLRTGDLQEAHAALVTCRALAPWQPSVYVLDAELARLQGEPWRIEQILANGLATAGPCPELLDYQRVSQALDQVPA
jgi:tetratricopeptide (TPR) repeat protein